MSIFSIISIINHCMQLMQQVFALKLPAAKKRLALAKPA